MNLIKKKMENMSVELTVAIPTYNGQSRLPKVLDKLRSQTGTEYFAWEILIIDNNSNDNTAKVVQEYQNSWKHPYPLKYFFEPQQGLVWARKRAIKEANGKFVAFLDDDNLPDNNWVSAAYSFGEKHPKAGVYGGQIHGNFEVQPPENFERIESFLAIKKCGSEPILYEPQNLRLPPGAALVICKQAWCESVPDTPILKGKMGKSLSQGEDYEISLHIYKAGWEIWYNPAMHTYHQIPHWRLERNYLLSIAYSCGLATCQLRTINAENWQKPMIVARTLLGNLRRVILHFIKYRGQLKTDLVCECEMAFFIGSLISPFYWLKTTLLKL